MALGVWFGDETCAGTGAGTPANRYSSLASLGLGLTERNYAKSGAGYAVQGNTLAMQISQAAADKTLDASQTTCVFLMAGLNDPYASLAGEQAAVTAAIAQARRTFSKATIVVGCGPGCIPDASDDDAVDRQAHVLTAIALAGEGADAVTIPDMRSVCGSDQQLHASGINPNDEGHRLLADAIVTAVEEDRGEPLDAPVVVERVFSSAQADFFARQFQSEQRRNGERREANRPTGTELTNLTGKLDALTRVQGLQQVILEQQQDQLAEQQRMLKEQQDQFAAQQKQLKSVQDQQASMLSTLQSQQTQLGQMQSNLENSIRSYINANLVPTLNANFAKVDDRFDKLEARVGKLEQGTPA